MVLVFGLGQVKMAKASKRKAKFPILAEIILSTLDSQYTVLPCHITCGVMTSAALPLNSCPNFSDLRLLLIWLLIMLIRELLFELTVQTNLIFHYAAFLSLYLSCSSTYAENCILKIEMWAFGYF